jgi:hypothetical protein
VKRTLAVGASLILTLCPAALAKKPKPLGPVRAVSEAGGTVAGAGAISQATATCPSGKKAVGGGFSSPFAPGNALVVNDSYRSAGDSWTVRAVVLEGGGAVTAFAYCRRTKGHPISDVPVSATLSTNGEVHTLAAECTAGRLIGGGFQSTTTAGGGAFLFPQANLRTSPTTWTVVEVANGDGARTATAHAYCMRRIRAPAVLSESNTAVVPASGSLASLTPACPSSKPRKAKLLSAGGFGATPVNGSPDQPIMVFGENGIGPGAGWLASAVNATGAPGTVSVTSQAICF